MAFTIEKSTVIQRPLEEVFNFHADLGNHADWHEHIVWVTQVNALPIGVGAKFEVVNKVAFGTNTDIREIIDYNPPHDYTYHITTTAFEGTSKQVCVAEGDATKFTVIGEFQFSGIVRLFEGLINRQLDKHIGEAVLELKHYLESEDR